MHQHPQLKFNQWLFQTKKMIVEVNNIRFYLDATDIELGSLHSLIIELLKDSSKLERFKQLLETDTNTAFNQFVNENNL